MNTSLMSHKSAGHPNSVTSWKKLALMFDETVSLRLAQGVGR